MRKVGETFMRCIQNDRTEDGVLEKIKKLSEHQPLIRGA